MALFTAASKHFVKTAGNASLHSVPDLNSAERCKTLCLVYRKTSFWPWKKAKIKPTLVTLNDILEKVSVAHLLIDCASARHVLGEVLPLQKLSQAVYCGWCILYNVQDIRHNTFTLVRKC